MPKQSLTIYLIKEKYSNNDECLRQEEVSTLESYSLGVNGATYTNLYLRRNNEQLPKWKSLFPNIDWSQYMSNTYAGLLVIDVSGRRFAIVSGSGRHLLNPFAIEASFGFKTVVNSVDPTTIRKIEKKTINQNPMNSIEQLARTSVLQDFQVDYYTDIISKIRAKSTVSEFGSIIDGRDSLHISIDCDADGIPRTLKACLDAYGSTRYRDYFPNIDNIAAVGDKELAHALDELIIQRLNQGDYEGCWASMPEIIQDTSFDCFQYSRRPSALRFYDIELSDCLHKYTSKQCEFTKTDLERDEIFVRSPEDYIYPYWHVWNCIYCELVHFGDLYILIDGSWYRVSQDFVQRLDDQISEIAEPKFSLPNWKQNLREEVYLRDLGGRYIVLDQDLVRVDGQAPIELCDLYLPDGIFIHVKRYGSSEVLSQLFNQGRVSAKLLIGDQRFRAEARKKFEDHAPFEENDRPDPRTFQIVFFIGSKHGNRQELPLFAKVVLVDTFNELQNYGFDVQLGFVQVDLV